MSSRCDLSRYTFFYHNIRELFCSSRLFSLLAACIFTTVVSSLSGQTVNAEFVNGIINASLVPGSGDIGQKINSAMSINPGGTVMIPNGTYSFGTTIQPPSSLGSGLTVDCGSLNTILKYTGSGDAIYINNILGPSIVFRNCTIDGSLSTGSSANGVHVQASSNVSFYDCIIKNFPGYGVYNQGAIIALYSNVSAITNGINLVDMPDTASGISTNALRWQGGSLQYGTTTNYWEAPGSSRDELNVLETTFEITSPVPQAIVEACDSCTIKNSYIEYIGGTGTGFPTMVIGNASGSGYGSGTNQTPKHFVLQNNLSLFPLGALGYEVFNVNSLTLNDDNEQGYPLHTIAFVSTPTLGITNVNVFLGLLNNSGGRYLNYNSSYFGQFQ